MDILSILSLILCITILISFALHHLLFKHKQSPHQQFPLPPGKTGLPFIGETLDYFLNVRKGVPEKFLRDRIKKYSSQVLRTSLLGQPMAILSGPEGNKLLFSNDNKLVKVWWPSSIDKIFPKPGNEATHENFNKIRKMLPVFLKADALKRLVGTMDHVMKDNVRQYWCMAPVLTTLPIIKKYTFTLACRLLLSIDDPKIVDRLEKPMEETVTGTHSLPLNIPGTAFHRAIKSSEIMRREVESMIKQRRIDLLEKRASATQDILSHMLLTTDENGKYLCELDIASNIVGLIHGTYATVNTTMAFILKFLAELPDVYQKVFEEQMKIAKSKGAGEFLSWEDTREMRYSWNVACEVLRLIPPGTGSFREAITDFTYNGYTIPKGWKIHWMHNATQKNPDYFPDPEKFDPSRFEGKGPPPYTYVPFGGGPRMCPGNEYARLVILVFMHNIVTNFKWEKLIPDEKVVHDPLPRPDQGLPLRLHPIQHP